MGSANASVKPEYYENSSMGIQVTYIHTHTHIYIYLFILFIHIHNYTCIVTVWACMYRHITYNNSVYRSLCL